MANYQARLDRLEETIAPRRGPRPMHCIHKMVNEHREVTAAWAEGQNFVRADGESVDELCQRVCAALGWEE